MIRRSQKTKRLLIDSDAGIDDSLAILLALASPETEVAAISAVFGNCTVSQATRNLCGILALVRPFPTIPVSQGASHPLGRRVHLTTTRSLHGKDGLGETHVSATSLASRRYGPYPGLGRIKKILRQEKIEGWVGMGPLTNAHTLFVRKESPKGETPERLVVLGGSFGGEAEFNLNQDPRATEALLSSGLPLEWIPVESSAQFWLRPEEIRRLQAFPGRVGAFLKKVLNYFWSRHREERGLDGCYLHDVVAMALALDRSLGRFGRWHLDLEKRPEGFFLKKGRGPSNCWFCEEIDSRRLKEFFIRNVTERWRSQTGS